MTRSTKSLVSVLTAVAITSALASSAMAADPSTINSIVGGQSPSSEVYSSPNAILADGGEPTRAVSGASAEPTAVSTVNALTGADQVASTSTAASTSTGDFEWGDALIGAAAMFALVLAVLAVSSLRRRSRRAVQPSH